MVFAIAGSTGQALIPAFLDIDRFYRGDFGSPARSVSRRSAVHFKRRATIQERPASWEGTLGPEHPELATSLENYAVLLRETGRREEAAEMEARAKAIRAKHAQENPVE